MERLRMAVIGVGHLGQAHARILSTLPGVELVGVADRSPQQARLVAERHGVPAFDDHRDLIPLVDAVSVVVPTTDHHRVARTFLETGIPVMVEKPMTLTVAEADDLVRVAAERDLCLQVGHIERFNGAFEELTRRRIQPKFIEVERHGAFTGRSMDIGVVQDLMIHDLDLLLALNRSGVTQVQALGTSLFGRHEDVVNARIQFNDGCVAQVTASRVSRQPRRRMRVWAAEGYASIDFATQKLSLVQPTEELRRRSWDVQSLSPEQRAQLKDRLFGELLQTRELECAGGPDQLTRELIAFADSVRNGTPPRVSGADGRAAVALAEAVLQSVSGHAWQADANAPAGPLQLPPPLGDLFETPARKAA